MKASAAILLVLILAAAGTAYYLYAGGSTPAGQPALTKLNAGNFELLKTEFNRASDSTRILVLVSPT